MAVEKCVMSTECPFVCEGLRICETNIFVKAIITPLVAPAFLFYQGSTHPVCTGTLEGIPGYLANSVFFTVAYRIQKLGEDNDGSLLFLFCSLATRREAHAEWQLKLVSIKRLCIS